ncbi:hypothetical protein C8R45DRAFT_1076626 [Mycena sanguinolenta]|nr:hypothetical protein C8R45DRAFT_1076626 [Mycena sanguinolenta]
MKENMKLFASEAVNGQGALSDDVSDTQYFDQYGINVAANVSMPFTPSSPGSPRSASSDLGSGAYLEDGSQSEDWYEACMDENSWDDAAMRRRAAVGDQVLSRDPSPAPSVEPVTPIKFEPEDEIKFEASNNFTESFVSTKPFNATHLSEFEKWVIGKIRDSHTDGISFAENLRRLQRRCEFVEGLDHHRRRILAEIHMLSRNLD